MVGRAKSVGIGGKPLKSELHHWWPRALSRLWEDSDGMVTRLSCDGTKRRAPAKQFGGLTNAHHMKIGGPWSTTIEPLFGDADTILPKLAQKLELLSFIENKGPSAFERRFTPHGMLADDRMLLGEGLASLLVRCPAHRNMLHLTTERFWGRTGDQVHKHDDSLIAGNIHQHYQQVVASLKSGGRIVLLRSGQQEFAMGEGYLSTLVGLTIQLQYHCLLPLTPTLAVLAFAPGRYRANPPVYAIGLAPEEVDYINDVTQIYSRDCIYYRSKPPRVIEAFKVHQFQELPFHRFPWLEALMQAAAM